MKIEQLCQTLKEYLSQFSAARVLMPLAAPIFLVCAAIQLITNFISFGALVNVITYLGFFIMLILVLANCQFRMMFIGLGIFTLENAINLLVSLLRYHYLNYTALVYLLFYGVLAYLAYKKSLQING